MRIRTLVAFVLLAVTGGPLAAQTSLQRVRTKAFPLAVVPWGALGFNGQRATADDPLMGTCAAPADCFEFGLGNGPVLGVDLQLPLPSTFGLQLTVSGAAPRRLRCTVGLCNSVDRVTMARGSALLLIRLKARAPIYLGLGGAASWIDQGVVQGIQDGESVTEFGGAGVIGYDVAMSSRVGARVAWAHYFLKPSDTGFTSEYHVENFAYDWLLSIGARIRIGS